MEVWIDRFEVWFEVWFERFKVVTINYLAQNNLLYLLDFDYYTGLWDKYFTIEGFITGLIFVAMVFFACDSGEKANFFKMVSFIAVINSCSAVTYYIYRLVNGYIVGYSSYMWGLRDFMRADNVLSGFLLTLTVVSCFHGSGGRAFLFGTATFAALPLMNYSDVIDYLGWIEIVFLLTQILIMGILCAIMSSRTYFYVSWLWCGGCSILLRVATLLVLAGRNLDLDTLGEHLFWRVIPEYIAFVVILGFAILFERLVIQKKTPGKKKAAAK